MSTVITSFSVFLVFSLFLPAEVYSAPKTRGDLYKLCTQKNSEACMGLAEVVWQDKTPESRKIGMEYLKFACALKNGAACDLARNSNLDSDWKTLKGQSKRSTASSKNRVSGKGKGKKSSKIKPKPKSDHK